MRIDGLARSDDGSSSILITRSKTDQLGEGSVRHVSADTMSRIDAYHEAAEIVAGHNFQGVRRGHAGQLTDQAVRKIYKARAAAVGLEASEISCHSTRVGVEMDASKASLSMPEIQQAGGWKSAQTVSRYIARQSVKEGAAAKLAKLQGR